MQLLLKMSILDKLLEIFLILGYLDKTLSSTSGSGGLLKSDQKHRTQKAAEKANELFCYSCQTMDLTKSECVNVTLSNHTKCEEDRRICMVKKVSFMSTGENATIGHKTWSLERSCTHRCDPGCIVIGERNKIYVCWTCCETSFCNTGTGGASSNDFNTIFFLIMPILTYFAKLFIFSFI